MLDEMCETTPGLAKKLKFRKDVGRPAVETDQPQFIKTLLDIAQHGAPADDRRRFEFTFIYALEVCHNVFFFFFRSETLRTVKTLDELTEGLRNAGFEVCRTSVYYRLLPRNSNTTDGKRHVRAVPVKLMKPGKDLHRTHEDGFFCTASMNALDELAALLGPTEVAKLSVDDKARVPLCMAAATSQSPLLMHMQYRVRLPDHDWAVADRHKLIPSVYAGVMIQENSFGDTAGVTYSGPTHVAIRSGKHSKSTAYSHARDLDHLFELPDFDSILNTPNGDPKPVLFLSVDGGPDENPRFQKNIEIAIHHFMSKNLDCLFICTNAPGRSAFNAVERRMAPLSRQLSGVVLPHDHFGSHLDSSGKTVDTELEVQNFKHAGQCLAEVFSSVIIDGYTVTAEFVETSNSEIRKSDMLTAKAEWVSRHVRSSQYLLQIVKCKDLECCTAFRSAYPRFVKSRFLPAPVPLCYAPDLQISTDANAKKFATLCQNLAFFNLDVPYDQYCPSVAGKLDTRVCSECGLYCASTVLQKKHRVVHKTIRRKIANKKEIQPVAEELVRVDLEDSDDEKFEVEWLDTAEPDPVATDEEDIVYDVEYLDEALPVVTMEEHFSVPWAEDDNN